MSEANKKPTNLEITDDATVNTTTMAVILGVTARRVQQMVQDGTIKTAERGRLLLIDGVHAYIDLLTNREKSEDEKSLDRAKLSAETKLKAAKADIAQLEAEELRGKMHRAEDVQAVTQDYLYEIRSQLTSLPGQLAVEVAAADSPAECAAIIRTVVNRMLLDFSKYKYDPEKYEERVRERQQWDAKDKDEDDAGD